MSSSDRHYVAFWGCTATGMACPYLWGSVIFGALAIFSFAMHLITAPGEKHD